MMRRSLRVLLLCVGLLLVVVGSASAIWVGPDNTLAIGETEVPERAKGVAVRTHPEITDFVNIDMLIRAKAEGGVFLGTSHRIDTESLLKGKRYFEITKMSLGKIGGVYTEGSPRATSKVLRPARLVGWLDSTTDPEWAELVVPLDGEPIDIVAVPDRRNARVTLSIGAHVAGLFWSQVAVALAGAVMIALSVVLGWWARRREAAGGTAKHARTPDDQALDQAPVPTPGQGPSKTPPSKTPLSEPLPLPQYPGGPSHWSRRRIVVVMILVPLSLALSSCAVPGSAPAAAGKETRTGMSIAEARALVPKATQVYAAEFTAYPMWALVAVERPDRLRLLTRSSFSAAWQTEAVVRVRGELPEPVPRAIGAGNTLLIRAERISASLADWWVGGETSGVALDRRTRRARAELWASGVSPESTWVMPPPPHTPPVRMVEVSRGHLAVLRHTLMTPTPRRLTTVVYLPSATEATVLGSSLVTVD